MDNYIQQILTYFRNMVLNSSGVERSLYKLIQDGDVSTAIGLMQNRDIEVDIAISEYNPQTHDVMKRPNKYRKGDAPYISEKLPRTRQRYINEVELFFLLGNNIKWKKTDGDDEAFSMFTDFLKGQRFDSNMRQVKRLAGAETESAKLYHIFRDDRTDEILVKTIVLARSKGHQLRPLFDQYGNMTAFAHGYKLKENGKTVQHWDIQTPDFLFFCKKGNIGWDVETYPNPTKKINVIYYHQEKAWDGAEKRLNREEILDSHVPHCILRASDDCSILLLHIPSELFKWDEERFPELHHGIEFIRLCKSGIVYNDAGLTAKITRLAGKIASAEGFMRMSLLMHLLHVLSTTPPTATLKAERQHINGKKENESPIDRAYRYLYGHFREQLSLNDLAAYSGLHPAALCRSFKKASGHTVGQFCSRLRIEHACNLLLTTDMDVAQIAYQSGYNSYPHFCTQFKKAMKMSPTEYRGTTGY